MFLENLNTGAIFGIVLACVAVVAGIIVILLTRKNKNKVVVDEQLVNNMISFLGGKENIPTYKQEAGRVKFEVIDLNKVDLESLKTISSKGVFVTGNNVKTLFKYDSNVIIKMLDKTLK